MSDIGSSERMGRQTVASGLEMTLIDKFYHQGHSRYNLVGEKLV